ncbi:MAG: hypothetical protein U9P50_01815 [Patescibacteria group bacterium]|nr:hypothetical protein [Patescibacteria group bacterium]
MYTHDNIKKFGETEIKIETFEEGVRFLLDFLQYWIRDRGVWEKEYHIFPKDWVSFGELFERPSLKREDLWTFVFKYNDPLEEKLWNGKKETVEKGECTHFSYPSWKFHYEYPSERGEWIISKIFGSIWKNPVEKFTDLFGETKKSTREGQEVIEWRFSVKKLLETVER